MKEFTLILTPGMQGNDKIVLDFVREKYGDVPCSFYRLSYAPPYQKDWKGIVDYENLCRYHPFSDVSQERIIIIDLQEWVPEGHIQEEFLRIFFMYLHDQRSSYFDIKYVFTAGGYEEEDVKELIILLSQYFQKKSIKTSRIFRDKKQLGQYLSENHKKISKELIVKIAGMLIEAKEKISGISQVDSLLAELENSIPDMQEKIDEKLLVQRAKQVRASGLYMLYTEEMERILGEYEKDDKER